MSELRLGEVEQLCLDSDSERWNSLCLNQELQQFVSKLRLARAGTVVSKLLRLGERNSLCLNSESWNSLCLNSDSESWNNCVGVAPHSSLPGGRRLWRPLAEFQ